MSRRWAPKYLLSGRSRLLLAAVMLSLAVMPNAYACTQSAADSVSESIAAERTKKRAVRGTFRIVRIEAQPYDHHKGDWRLVYGTITLKSGKVIETVHPRDDLLVMCGRPEGPARDAVGTFYLNWKKRDGRLEIFDWHGAYLPLPAQSMFNQHRNIAARPRSLT